MYFINSSVSQVSHYYSMRHLHCYVHANLMKIVPHPTENQHVEVTVFDNVD